ncbi:cupin domain-containing protein [Paracoccus stylophorae]
MTMTAGITRATEGVQGISWNILGQIYVPKQVSDAAMSWHATFPQGTFVPPHIHPTQDEFLYILDGCFDLLLDGAEHRAVPGDLVRLPMGVPHGIFNKSDTDIKCLFWVSPTRRLFDLFWALHNLGPDANPAEVVAVSAAHEVDFLPPPEDADPQDAEPA